MSRETMLTGLERSRLVWYKAQASTAHGQCVQVARTGGKVVIRDSKNPDGAVLVYTRAEFSAFLEGVRNGEFDHFGR
jgi:hypothetical protein